MNLQQIGEKIHNKRIETGLMQGHIAKLAGVSRVTVNQLENGKLNDLGYTKLKAIMDILGMSIEADQSVKKQNAIAIAARSISTSYHEVVTTETLTAMLRSGIVPTQYQAHIMSLLDETPLPIVISAVAEAATKEISVNKIMKHLGVWAKQWKVCRTVW